MKAITAIVQPFMLRKVMEALHDLPHFPGVTVTNVQGQGRGRGVGGAFKITEDGIDYHRKVRVEVFCDDVLAHPIVTAIRRASHTGKKGDGIIVVTDLNRVVRIRTEEEQDDAV